MTNSNVEIVTQICNAWAAGDFHADPSVLDEQIVFVLRPEFPDAGEYEGLAALADYMLRFLEPWEKLTISPLRFEAVGDTVLVHVRQRGKGISSGAAVEFSYFMLFTLRDNKIVRLENVMDEADARAAASSPA